jgi:hypothetical protein
VWITRHATLYHFAFFSLIMPIVELVEVPDSFPASIPDSLQAGASLPAACRGHIDP